MNIKVCFISLVFIINANNSSAKDFGLYGNSFEIKETDLLEEIYKKLNLYKVNGLLGEHQQKIAKKYQEYIKRPNAVANITKTKEQKLRFFDPTMVIMEDIDSGDGKVVLAGTKINPLDYTNFDEEWIFIDGDDDKQLKYANNISLSLKNSKTILVKGKPGTQIIEGKEHYYYFDQAGVYCKKFGINKVPSILRQSTSNPKLMEIEEVYLNEKNL